MRKIVLAVRSIEGKPKVASSIVYFEQIKDEVFEETEKNFRMQERLIKSFIRDLSLYLQHIRVSVHIALVRKVCSFVCHLAYCWMKVK
jgi:hypothetical protein